jgi:CDP-diacylglycerol---glycerol-3-phosphate 3-phosphatidyltransferase
MFKNIPNLLTLLRIIAIPVFITVFYLPWQYAHLCAAAIFAAACATDWLDGYLARRLKQTTRFGAFLDPVADKLIVVAALIMIVSTPFLTCLVVPVIVIIGREIVISALREWMAEVGKRTSVAVVNIAKWKTLVQMGAIVILVAYTPDIFMASWVKALGYIAIYVATLLTLWTMLIYLYASRNAFDDV